MSDIVYMENRRKNGSFNTLLLYTIGVILLFDNLYNHNTECTTKWNYFAELYI